MFCKLISLRESKSLHKTLPSLTQTALLHVNGKLTDRRKLRSMLSVYQSSSPSYVLMASIDSCIRYLSEHGDELFDSYRRCLMKFREQARELNRIAILQTDDPSRILLRPENMSAAKLYDLLRGRYRLQPEMLAPSYVLMLSSAADTEEGFSRLLRSLRELDRIPDEDTSDTLLSREDSIYLERPVVRHSLFRALNSPQEKIPFESAEGSVSAEYLYLYPPGVPLLAP